MPAFGGGSEKKQISVLIVDDSEDDYVLMRDMLEDLEDYRVESVWCKGYDDGIKEALNAHDICLIDYVLGGKNGVQLIEDAVQAGNQSPMIIFTARGNHHVDLEAMDKGAVDYLTKGEFDEALLERTIRYAMDRKRAELALAAANASLEKTVGERTADLNNAKAMLERRQNTLHTLLHNAPVAIWMADSNRKMNFINQTFLDIQGIDKQDILAADDYYSLLPDNIREQWQSSDDECFQRGICNSREKWLDADGIVHTFDIVKAKVMGETDRLVGIGIDVTRQLELQAQMEHAQRLESLGVLAGGIAHDFNNLLAIIMANSGLAQRRLDQPDFVNHSLNKVTDASQRAADLCKQMMAYAGKGDYEPGIMLLSDMVASMSDLMRISISHNISVQHHLSNQPLEIMADEAQLQQVIMNLLINAAEAIGEHTPGLIRITTGRMSADRDYLQSSVSDSGTEAGDYCFIEISDNGCGMDGDTCARLFDPFFTTKFTGRGLGMSAMLGIIRGHRGAIKVDSEAGVGTTIRVLLPATNVARQQAVEANQSIPTWQGYGTALVVDDEPGMREMASVLMQGLGFMTLEAEDGLVAIDVFRQHRDDISIVVLDLSMPRMNGEACFRELRAIKPDVKVVLSSGYSESEATARFADKGLSGFVQKPYSPETFENMIQAAFSKTEKS